MPTPTDERPCYVVRMAVADLAVEVRTPDARARDEVLAIARGFRTDDEPITVVHLDVGDADSWAPPSKLREDAVRLTPPGLTMCADRRFRHVSACLSEDNLYWLTRAVLRTVYCNLLGLCHGMPLHAAGVVKDDRAYVFVGPSGSGKTTLARHSAPYTLLDDDLVFVRKVNGAFFAHSNPGWARSMPGMDEAKRFDLAGIYRLRHGRRPALTALPTAAVAAEILALPPGATAEVCEDLLATCDELAREVPCFELSFAPDDRFWELIASGS